MALIMALTSHSQVSISTGLSSRFQPVFKVAVEKPTGWINTELSTLVSLDNTHPVIGLQSGLATQNEGDLNNYRFMLGAFYHTGLLPMTKNIRVKTILFGGSFRWQIARGFFGIEYNGETVNMHLGYIFNRKK